MCQYWRRLCLEDRGLTVLLEESESEDMLPPDICGPFFLLTVETTRWYVGILSYVLNHHHIVQNARHCGQRLA